MFDSIVKLKKKILEYLKTLLTEDLYKGYQIQLEKLCKKLELNHYVAKFEDHISGSIIKDKNANTYTIYVNKDHPRNRQRFTLAHEIGHYISYLVGSFSKEELEERGGFEDRAISYRKEGNYSAAEAEANLIAAEILMPKKMVGDLLKKELTPEEMAEEFFVSTSAMTIRLIHLYPEIIIV